MKLVKTMVLAGVALAVAGGAWAQDVKVDYDKAANFGAIKTFSLKLGTSWGNQIGEKRVTDEITQALTEKGWTVAPEGQADAQVVLHGATETKRSLNTFYSGGWAGTATGAGAAWAAWARPPRPSPSTPWARWWWTSSTRRERACSGAAPPRTSCRTRPTRTSRSSAKASDKLFKDFPPGSAKK